MEFEQRKTTVLMFPWLAHGHISPFLELAKTLSRRNFMVYLCSTRDNLGCIRRRISDSHVSSCIQLIELHVPALPGLPPNCHTTKNLPPHLMPTLKKAFDQSVKGFSDLLKALKPDLLLYDTIQPWAPSVASRLGIPAVAFVSTSATMTSLMLHRHRDSGKEFPFPKIHLHDFEDEKLDHLLQSSENYYNQKNRFVECLEQSSGIILIKSSRKIEGKYIDYLSVLSEKKIVPVGPLVLQPSANEPHRSSILQWLDKREHSSTVFVSFGSEYFLTIAEMEEMAHGLELSGVNFIWVIRFPAGVKSRVEEALPQGFLEKVSGRGLVVENWAPQVQILEHPNTGGFVSHCGWSSMMEGIHYGVPIIAIPMHLDQPVNARLLQDVGAGVEVKRDENGSLFREEIARVVKEVVEKETGEAVKKKQIELGDAIRMEEQEVVDGLVDELLQLCLKNNKNMMMMMKQKKKTKKDTDPWFDALYFGDWWHYLTNIFTFHRKEQQDGLNMEIEVEMRSS
ncbi:beta-D-glucosyl crocetin beta-1,6-glucosyltransferase-like [Diospyros lotus]|uniref:beta-D-glucosyl crocetin beta-1,6-glucosyltransferase-like n=1 Tax=Diospyros lotus TaxID=55363 RepID=UPI00224DFA1B|nr:beta-D-glucosyl crocetin beta-1,6-glucosyltransferase-like [Diospyros lotus]